MDANGCVLGILTSGNDDETCATRMGAVRKDIEETFKAFQDRELLAFFLKQFDECEMPKKKIDKKEQGSEVAAVPTLSEAGGVLLVVVLLGVGVAVVRRRI